MKYKFYCKLFIIILLIGSSNSFAQSKEETIDRINGYVDEINLDTNLKSVTLQNTEFLENMTDGGGELTGFYKDNKFYKVYQNVGISYGVYITEYYYNQDQLIFVGENFNAYIYDDSLKTFDYTKSNSTYSGIFYFDNGKIIHTSSKGHGRTEDDTVDSEKFLIEESDKNIRLLNAKFNSVK